MKMPVWDYSDNWSYLYFEESLWSVKYHVWQNLGGDDHGHDQDGADHGDDDDSTVSAITWQQTKLQFHAHL